MTVRWLVVIISIMAFGTPQLANANQDNCASIGRVLSSQGNVKVQRNGSSQWGSIRRRGMICEGDTLKTGFRSRAAVRLANETVLRLKQGTSTSLTNFSSKSETK
jgi:hypothetical protein